MPGFQVEQTEDFRGIEAQADVRGVSFAEDRGEERSLFVEDAVDPFFDCVFGDETRDDHLALLARGLGHGRLLDRLAARLSSSVCSRFTKAPGRF